MKLVIAEKPSVAMALAAVLGADEKKDGYLEGGGYLRRASATFWSWHSLKPTGNSMPDGAMAICRSCRTNGNMRCRRTRRNSLTSCAG